MSKRLERTEQAQFQPYRKYRPVGFEWLSQVPEHWSVGRLRWTVLTCQNGIWGDEPDGQDDLPCVRVADFERTAQRVNMGRPTMRSIKPSAARGRTLERGDLLLEKSGGGEKQPVGAVVLYDHDLPAVCSNFVARVQIAEGHDANFLCYLHHWLYSSRVNTRSIKQSTGIQNLDSYKYLSEIVAAPPLPEQLAIAEFLDRRTAKIDALVSKKEELIKLLQGKRTALITHAVTKGLDPNAPMKDSGVEWLGEIPVHWKTSRIKYLCIRVVDGVHHTPKYVEAGVPFVTVKNLSRAEGISFDDLNYISEEDHREFIKRANPQRGDVLLTKDGATLGIPRVVDIDREFSIFVSVALMKLRTQKIIPDFMRFGIESCPVQEQLQATKAGSALPHIHLVDLRNATVAIPPVAEQQAIVDRLNRELEGLQKVVARVGTAVERLKELRTALISAAVTGKIDVRTEAP